MSGVCGVCNGSATIPVDFDPFTNGWTCVDCPDCMDPALPEVPLCRYCDRLPDCAHVCDRCMSEASAEQAAQIPDDYDPFQDYELEDML